MTLYTKLATVFQNVNSELLYINCNCIRTIFLSSTDNGLSTGTAITISIVVTFIITLIVTTLISVIITRLCYKRQQQVNNKATTDQDSPFKKKKIVLPNQDQCEVGNPSFGSNVELQSNPSYLVFNEVFKNE